MTITKKIKYIESVVSRYTSSAKFSTCIKNDLFCYKVSNLRRDNKDEIKMNIDLAVVDEGVTYIVYRLANKVEAVAFLARIKK